MVKVKVNFPPANEGTLAVRPVSRRSIGLMLARGVIPIGKKTRERVLNAYWSLNDSAIEARTSLQLSEDEGWIEAGFVYEKPYSAAASIWAARARDLCASSPE
jgi:hypothetical protein